MVLGTVLLFESSPALASTGESLELPGYAFAEQHCAECHRIAPGELASGNFNAPSFQAVANDPAITRTSLKVFLQTPHSRMPDFILTGEQSDQVIDYILNLKQ